MYWFDPLRCVEAANLEEENKNENQPMNTQEAPEQHDWR